MNGAAMSAKNAPPIAQIGMTQRLGSAGRFSVADETC